MEEEVAQNNVGVQQREGGEPEERLSLIRENDNDNNLAGANNALVDAEDPAQLL